MHLFFRKNKLSQTCNVIKQIHATRNKITLKDKFCILLLKPCFKIVSDEIERLRLQFGHMLLAQEFSVSVVEET